MLMTVFKVRTVGEGLLESVINANLEKDLFNVK